LVGSGSRTVALLRLRLAQIKKASGERQSPLETTVQALRNTRRVEDLRMDVTKHSISTSDNDPRPRSASALQVEPLRSIDRADARPARS
jgi:hypothetical protein